MDTHLSKEDHIILAKLASLKHLVFIKADKGNTCVILNKDDYVKKMMDILSDKSKFKEVQEVDSESRSRLKKFQHWLYRHKWLFGAQYDTIRPSSSRSPIQYPVRRTASLRKYTQTVKSWPPQGPVWGLEGKNAGFCAPKTQC